MPISDAVIRRRQLDLDKRTAELNEYFELVTRDAIPNMRGAWESLELDLVKQVRAIYKQMGAIKDPEKLKILQNKVDRLDAYMVDINSSLAGHQLRAQAYTTGLLKGQFERAYYMTGWGIEQAARVTASVPLLSTAQVLGVLVNPWLPDGATYSDRIRASTAMLAKEMRNTIETAVKEGLGWNTTARMISKAAGEGYFRGVTLARTELNRAAALGASYSYIQNNDIMDCKRWNATLDSRVAVKDAANDGKTFDLDYDTPGKPGVPGKRIPNHPNCRCLWSPVLSALGISDRERIARGEGDTPETYGKRIYTKARTYTEYAKERGLPSLNSRRENDNLKAYLRPGEPLESLSRRVRRFTLNGKSIEVPKIYWEAPGSVKAASTTVIAPNTSVASTEKPQPAIITKIKDTVSRNFTDGKVSDRRGYARELLDACDLVDVPNTMEQIKGQRGYCSLDYRSDGLMHVGQYTLQLNDTRADAYKVKTSLHELFHANSNGLPQDILSSGYSFTQWVDIEETFTESAAQYLMKAAGVDSVHPSYCTKLVNNLPRLKQLPMFKDCNTIEDFGEVMVNYRMVNKNPSNWQRFIDIVAEEYDPALYIIENYKEHIDANFDALYNRVVENSPNLKGQGDFKDQAVRAWEDAKDYNRMPVGSNARAFFYDIAVAAMQAQGVK